MTTIGYHDAVKDFRRRLIEATLHQCGGNRTHAARALGLQRTYLLRLIRELSVAAPPPRGEWRNAVPVGEVDELIELRPLDHLRARTIATKRISLPQ